MRFIHIQHQLWIVAFEINQSWQVGHITIHAEDALRHQDDGLVLGGLLGHYPFQLCIVVVPIA